MEFYILNNTSLRFENIINPKDNERYRMAYNFPAPQLEAADEDLLKRMTETLLKPNINNKTWRVGINIFKSSSNKSKNAETGIFVGVWVTLGSWNAITSFLSSENLQLDAVHLKLVNFKRASSVNIIKERGLEKLSSLELEKTVVQDPKEKVKFVYYRSASLKLSNELWSELTRNTLPLTATVTICWNLSPLSRIQEVDSTNRKMLKRTATHDFTLIGVNGRRFSCHKMFLAAQSPFFEAMFRSGMSETETNSVKMEDISEDAVETLLDYFYCKDLWKARKKCAIAFDLLMASEMYEMPGLQEEVENILLEKRLEEWDDVEVALDLYYFAGKMKSERRSELKKKAIQVMKNKFVELQATEKYQKLFKENPDAQELFEFSFQL